MIPDLKGHRSSSQLGNWRAHCSVTVTSGFCLVAQMFRTRLFFESLLLAALTKASVPGYYEVGKYHLHFTD